MPGSRTRVQKNPRPSADFSKTNPLNRGGVEDRRLEAKAKDTKKIRGQGQPFRGQTLSRPRTEMLEAKAKNQGHKRKSSPKKKGLQKHFSGDLKKQRFSEKIFRRSPEKPSFKKFSGAPQTFNNSKIVLSSSQGQANFRGLEASRPRPRTSKCVLEAQNVLKDSTSASQGQGQECSRPRIKDTRASVFPKKRSPSKNIASFAKKFRKNVFAQASSVAGGGGGGGQMVL